jgi:hypothetical protein
MKYSQNWMKQKPKFLFFPKRDRVQSRDEGELGGGHATPWRGPPHVVFVGIRWILILGQVDLLNYYLYVISMLFMIFHALHC